jgi:hypothetical protein
VNLPLPSQRTNQRKLSAPMNVAMLIYSAGRVKRALRVTQFLAQQPGARNVILVLNGSEIRFNELIEMWGPALPQPTVLLHDNSGAEFGGYQRVVDHCRQDAGRPLLILNDTVGVHQFVDRPYLRDLVKALRANTSSAIAVGRMCRASEPIAIGGLSGHGWLRSHMMGFGANTLGRIDYRLRAPEFDSLIQETGEADRFFHPDICLHLRQHWNHWLFGTGAGTWYKAQALTPESAPFLANRARAMVQEIVLSMRLEQAGVQFLNLDPDSRSDMATRLRRGAYHKLKFLPV